MAVSKLRNLRVDDELWKLAGIVTKRRRETISGVMKRLLAEYVEQYATEEDRKEARGERYVRTDEAGDR